MGARVAAAFWRISKRLRSRRLSSSSSLTRRRQQHPILRVGLHALPCAPMQSHALLHFCCISAAAFLTARSAMDSRILCAVSR
eukprot:6214587-Pleurochrysis_carterae.AAC.1